MGLLETVRPALRWARPSARVNLAGIDIRYRKELDGGGADFGQDFISFLRNQGMPKQKRIFEWCAGPGFIGFSLLGHGMCETLCLADINAAAVDSCIKTASLNRLSDRVSVYQSDNLRSIPHSEKWDLVVSNPPHFIDQYIGDIRAHDPGWRIHKDFFATISSYLADDAVIVLQENNRGSTVETFRPMIENNGFQIAFTSGDHPALTDKSSFYFIGIVRGDSPAWVMTQQP
jgi:methylase of polypeptide subunit release factors